MVVLRLARELNELFLFLALLLYIDLPRGWQENAWKPLFTHACHIRGKSEFEPCIA